MWKFQFCLISPALLKRGTFLETITSALSDDRSSEASRIAHYKRLRDRFCLRRLIELLPRFCVLGDSHAPLRASHARETKQKKKKKKKKRRKKKENKCFDVNFDGERWLEFIASIDGFVNASKSIGRIEFLATESNLSWPRTEIWTHRGNVSTNRSSASGIERSLMSNRRTGESVSRFRAERSQGEIDYRGDTLRRHSGFPSWRNVAKERKKTKNIFRSCSYFSDRTTLLFCFPLVSRRSKDTLAIDDV